MHTQPHKFAVLGDIHANLEALDAVLEDARLQGCTHHACVGDIVGYNANPRECLSLLRQLNLPCVKGNHDDYCSTEDRLEGLNPRAIASALWTRRQLDESDKAWLRGLKHVRHVAGFLLVHATLDVPQRWGYVFERMGAAASFSYQNTPVCFFGHTHLPKAFVRNGVVREASLSVLKVEPGSQYFINVGSVGEPRDGTALATYVVYDLAARTIELRRIAYDASTADAKVRAAGLPPRRKIDVSES